MGHADYQAFVLNKEQLKDLCGYERPTHMCKWLDKNGIQYFLGGDGFPKVLIENIRQAAQPKETPKRKWLLNL